MISGGEMSPETFLPLHVSTELLSVSLSEVAGNVWRHFGCEGWWWIRCCVFSLKYSWQMFTVLFDGRGTVIFAHVQNKVSNLLLFMLTFTCENHTVRLKGNDCVGLRQGELWAWGFAPICPLKVDLNRRKRQLPCWRWLTEPRAWCDSM